MKKLLFLVISLCCCAVSIQAQSAYRNGKKVKKITFNHEEVMIEYANKSQEVVTGNAVVTRTPVTGIEQVETEQEKQPTSWYQLDGRQLKSQPKNSKGIFIVKEGNKVRKTIQK